MGMTTEYGILKICCVFDCCAVLHMNIAVGYRYELNQITLKSRQGQGAGIFRIS